MSTYGRVHKFLPLSSFFFFFQQGLRIKLTYQINRLTGEMNTHLNVLHDPGALIRKQTQRSIYTYKFRKMKGIVEK